MPEGPASEAPLSRYVRPESTEEALDLLATGNWRILAGGTDFYPAQGNRPIRDDILDIDRLDGLAAIRLLDDHVLIGARASWTDVLRADLPPSFDALKLAAREVGSIQIQNRGTVAGNLCNASPAADGVPPLLTLDASVELASADGVRVLPLDDFILGNRKTARRPDELVVAVRFPVASPKAGYYFEEMTQRHGDFAICAVAAVAEDNVVRLGVGGVAERSTVREWTGLAEVDIDDALNQYAWELGGSDDIHATAEYRRQLVRRLGRRAILEARKCRK